MNLSCSDVALPTRNLIRCPLAGQRHKRKKHFEGLSCVLKGLAQIHRYRFTIRFFFFLPVNSTPPLHSLWRVISHGTSICHKYHASQKCWDEYGLNGYFRMEDGNLVMLDMVDSCQDKTGRTERMKLKVLLFLEGPSVAETGEHGILICEEIDVLNLCMLASVASVPLYYGIQTMVSLSSPRG